MCSRKMGEEEVEASIYLLHFVSSKTVHGWQEQEVLTPKMAAAEIWQIIQYVICHKTGTIAQTRTCILHLSLCLSVSQTHTHALTQIRHFTFLHGWEWYQSYIDWSHQAGRRKRTRLASLSFPQLKQPHINLSLPDNCQMEWKRSKKGKSQSP